MDEHTMNEENITFDGRIMGFLRAARGRSQEEIIIEFLQAAIRVSPAADAGSVLINHPKMEKLVLFNEDDFLFSKGLLDPKSRASWPKQFTYFSGIAGRCFREKAIQTLAAGDDDFVGDSPIKNMVCIPIMTMQNQDPFGVACFHNNVPGKLFSEDDKRALVAYTDILSLALHTPHPELQLERNIFIVHGRDTRSLADLQKILRDQNVSPKVLARKDKNAVSILSALEELIRTCRAGFILATPDDEGRLKGQGEIAGRARENVIFETGLLFAKFRAFERVAILLKRPLTLPSDLNGISYEEFDDLNSLRPAIEQKLSNWGLLT
jgi:hypothetical protein